MINATCFIITSTGLLNGPVLFCTMSFVGRCHLSSVMLPAVGPAGCRVRGRSVRWRPTMHGRPVRLRPIRRHLVLDMTERAIVRVLSSSLSKVDFLCSGEMTDSLRMGWN